MSRIGGLFTLQRSDSAISLRSPRSSTETTYYVITNDVNNGVLWCDGVELRRVVLLHLATSDITLYVSCFRRPNTIATSNKFAIKQVPTGVSVKVDGGGYSGDADNGLEFIMQVLTI